MRGIDRRAFPMGLKQCPFCGQTWTARGLIQCPHCREFLPPRRWPRVLAGIFGVLALGGATGIKIAARHGWFADDMAATIWAMIAAAVFAGIAVLFWYSSRPRE